MYSLQCSISNSTFYVSVHSYGVCLGLLRRLTAEKTCLGAIFTPVAPLLNYGLSNDAQGRKCTPSSHFIYAADVHPGFQPGLTGHFNNPVSDTSLARWPCCSRRDRVGRWQDRTKAPLRRLPHRTGLNFGTGLRRPSSLCTRLLKWSHPLCGCGCCAVWCCLCL